MMCCCSISEDIKCDCEVCVIGLGPVGLAAMFVLGEEGVKCIGVDYNSFVGGQAAALYPQKQMKNVLCFEGSATQMIQILEKQVVSQGPHEMKLGEKVTRVVKDKKFLRVEFEGKKTIACRAVIVATGHGVMKLRTLSGSYANVRYDQPDEALSGASVAVLGGGATAFEVAKKLLDQGNTVYLVHRRRNFAVAHSLTQPVLEQCKFLCIPDPESALVVDGDKITGIRTDGEGILEVDTVHCHYGLWPTQEACDVYGLKTVGGKFDVSNSGATEVPGIYIAGDAAAYRALNELWGEVYPLTRHLIQYLKDHSQ